MARTRRGKGLEHVGIERRTVNGPEWAALSPAAKIFYLQLKARYNGNNNGEIKLPYRSLKDVRGCSHHVTISKASIELQEKG